MKKVKPIGCEEALKHLLAYLDQEVGAVTHREVEQHLEICRTCFSRAEFERSLKIRLREVGRGTMRSSFEKRIKTLFDQFTTKQKRETP
ncbi:MAG: zf-HC2 domain-containing protein [Nitrospira sp.]|nr:zf-HC2 domain-containing protein [Nitrospira sp.]